MHLGDEIKTACPYTYVVQLVTEALNERGRCLNGAHVLALGVAYKCGVADMPSSDYHR